MEFNEWTYNLFDDFLSGKLSEVENVELEKTLEEDENIREEFSFYTSAVTTIRMSGNQILKKQLAAIGMGIPSGAFQKYSPSIKPKNFFRKYWWAISIVSVIILAATLFILHKKQNSESDELSVPIKIDSINKKDSVFDKTDTTSDFDKGVIGQDIQNASLFESGGDGENCRTFSIPILPNSSYVTIDSENKVQNLTSANITWKNGNHITVTFCPQNKQPPYYTFTEGINIYASYADSTNIRFYEMSADGLIMRDNISGYFILKRGSGQEEKLLVRTPEGGTKSLIKSKKDVSKRPSQVSIK